MADLDAFPSLGNVRGGTCHCESAFPQSPQRVSIFPVLTVWNGHEMTKVSALFLQWFTLCVGAGIVIVVTLVVVVDPYDQYRVIIKEGFNATKPELTRYQNEIKLAHAVQLHPDVLILGNSRAEAGLDPEAPVLLRSGISAYNLAVPGMGILTSRRQVEYLSENGTKPKTIILGLEFLDFMQSVQPVT